MYLDFQKLHEVYIPTNQAARQSEVPTSGYGKSLMVAHVETASSAEVKHP
jgi:hypothetical protein